MDARSGTPRQCLLSGKPFLLNNHSRHSEKARMLDSTKNVLRPYAQTCNGYCDGYLFYCNILLHSCDALAPTAVEPRVFAKTAVGMSSISLWESCALECDRLSG